jgi:nitroimidazol reductase NimA-like FMN-containing flavoprotein (pyridoxamine 5'-phosphate oxidase superfamily)
MSALHREEAGRSKATNVGQPRGSRTESHPVTDPPPVFEELDITQCHVILDRNRVGRIAYSFHDQVDIAPVHYVRRKSWLYGRTAPGAKLTTLARSPWVAFEVDEIEALFEWRSVVVHGAFYHLTPGGTTYDVNAWETGIEALCELIPTTFLRSDPIPDRSVMFRISIDRISGRAARPGT